VKKLSILVTGFLWVALIIQSCYNHPEYIKIAVTTDVHGTVFPFDLISGTEVDYSLAHVHQYVSKQKQGTDTAFFILDNGDFLQGQPTVYYNNPPVSGSIFQDLPMEGISYPMKPTWLP
jgi:2',3'-cyclic-nucleotide 2'-phosphodiesterase (5'-nucleotidase family)